MTHTTSIFGKLAAISLALVISLLFVAQPSAAIPAPDPGGPGPASPIPGIPSPSGGGTSSVDTANAQAICEGSGGVWSGTSCSNGGPTLMGTISNVTNILLYIMGAIAVIMVIVGGIRYATSAGDQTAVTGAKNTILYAIIGLVVAFLAYALVNFVLVQVFK